MSTFCQLHNSVQHYAWGGYDFLPDLLGHDNSQRRPQAELWLGAHPKGPSTLVCNGQSEPLNQAIRRSPERFLGTATMRRFGPELPYLLKILDVRQMLSIQVHPTKAEAEKGYDREEAAGIPRDAAQRNYRDRNHKPELMVALTDFWLLHGFQPVDRIAGTLAETPGWASLRSHLERGGIAGLYRYVMEAEQAEIDRLLQPLADELGDDKTFAKNDPHHWAQLAFADYTSEDGHYDRGIFSIYWFNLVNVPPGQGIFQAAGIPHAYLEGVNVELMANSDNVLRGGLTPKHIDAEELLKHTHCVPITPHLLTGRPGADGETHYPTPAPDFHLTEIHCHTGQSYQHQADGPEIYLLLAGEITVTSGHKQQRFHRGESFFCFPGADIQLVGEGRLFRAGVGV